MAETMDDPLFWLPTHFLTDDDFLLEKEKASAANPGGGGGGGGGGLRQNSLYLSMFGVSSASALDSPVSSTETEAEQDEFLAELTRQLAQSTLHESHKFDASQGFRRDAIEKSLVLGTSPQSTLSGFGNFYNRSGSGSPNGPSQVPSPPATPSEAAENDAWELIYAAAGQVKRMKMNPQQQTHFNHQNRGLLGVNPPPLTKSNNIGSLYSAQTLPYDFPQLNQTHALWARQGREPWRCQPQPQQLQSRGRCGGGGVSGGALGLPQSAWPPLRVQEQHHSHLHHQARQHQQSSVLVGGSAATGIKRQSAGTGVFLPRRVTTATPPEPRKKTGCSTVLLPARVVQALNLNLEEMNAHHPQQVFLPDHDFLMARRNAMWARQRRSMRPEGTISNHHEIRLPQEWTY